MTIKFDLSEATVEEAAKVLDQVVPKWYHNIDLTTFNIGSPCKCILGQLYSDFHTGLNALDNFGVRRASTPFGAEACNVNDPLQKQWSREIDKRLKTDPKPLPPPEVTYRVGTWFKRANDSITRGLLAQVDASKVALIAVYPGALGDANRVVEAVLVKDIYKITEAEFNKIKGYSNWVKE